MKKATRDALRAYAAAVPHVGYDTLVSEINARVNKGAAEPEIVGIAHDVIRAHEKAAQLTAINARHEFVASTQ